MDKFGIFNLLNSFFSLNSQNAPQKSNESATSAFDKILSSLANSVPKKDNALNNKSAEQSKKTFAPLQSAMLSTMQSHDEFLKRVKQKNKA